MRESRAHLRGPVHTPNLPTDSGGSAKSGVRPAFLAALGYLLFALTLLWPILVGRVPVASDTLYLWAPWSQLPHEPVNTPVLADSSLLFLPWLVFGREAVQGGEWPMWDPNSFAGFPYAANSQSQLYYPLTWLLWLLPLSGHIQVLSVFNVWLAGFGTYLFVRRLGASRLAAFAAGVAFAGSGIMQLATELWGVSSVYGWLPWILYFADRALTEHHLGWSAAAAGAVALQLVAGNLQYAVYTLFILAVWVAWRAAEASRARGWLRAAEYIGRASAIVALGVGAALVHLAPVLELSALSSRAGARVSSNSPPLYSMLRSLAPQFFGDGGSVGSPLSFNDLWYAGVPAMLLAALALLSRPRSIAWLWAGLAFVAIAVAYGIGPFLHARWIPGLSGLLPIRIGFIFVFSVAVLSALGLDAFVNVYRLNKRRALLSSGFAVLLGGAATAGALGLRSGESGDPLRTLQDQQIARLVTLLALTVVLLLLAGHVAARYAKASKPAFVAAAAIAALLVVDLSTAVPGYNTFVRPQDIIPASSAIDWLRGQETGGRVLGRGVLTEQPVFVPNVQTLYGFSSVAGYDSLHTRDYEDFWAAVDSTITRGSSSTPYSNVFVRPQAFTSTAASLLDVQYVASTVPLSVTEGITLAYQGEILIYRVEPRLPRAYFVAHAEVLGRDRLLAALASPDFDPASGVLLNSAESPPGLTGEVDSAGIVPAEITSSRLNSVEVRVEAPSDGWLVLGEAYYPGWTATVNGAVSKVYSAFLALRAVQVRSGENIVQFEYTPTAFSFTVPVSLVALGVILVSAAFGFAKPKSRDSNLRT